VLAGAQIALLFQAVQHRVQATRTDAVAVAGKLFHHAEAEDRWLMDSMVENMQADQTGIEVMIDVGLR
jgi:hypothetical protein